MRLKIKLDRHEQVVGRPMGHPTYAVLVDGTEIGTVKIVCHNRFGDLWAAFDPTGKEVAQARARRQAAAALMALASRDGQP